MNFYDRISSTPNVMPVKPVIRGRITVELILMKTGGGYSFREILEMYPHLNKEDILAAVRYAASILGSEETL